jgi:hypothetical protein
MKLAFAIATIAALQQPAVTHADCDFGLHSLFQHLGLLSI